MTMRITIKNEDAHRDAKVTVQDISKDTGHRKEADRLRLKPGESREFYIHQLRDLLVEEVNPSVDG